MRFISVVPILVAFAAADVSGHETSHETAGLVATTSMDAAENAVVSLTSHAAEATSTRYPSPSDVDATQIVSTGILSHANATHTGIYTSIVGTGDIHYTTNGTNVTGTGTNPPVATGAGSSLARMGYGAFIVAIAAMIGAAF